jgi:hypothetical protein
MHTNEPWERGISEDSVEIFAQEEQGMLQRSRRVRVATCNSKFLDKIPNEANAQRIVDCVNACQGIDSLNIVKEAGAMYEELKRCCEACWPSRRIGLDDCDDCSTMQLINRIEADQ